MDSTRLLYGINRRPLINPQDITTSATASAFVSLKSAIHAQFNVFFGNIAAASADQSVTVTVEAATAAASGSEVAVAGKYRLTGINTANTIGAVTAFTTSGISVGTTDDGKIVMIDVDPAAMETALADASYVRVVVTPDAGATATLVAAWVDVEPRYPQTTHISTT